MIRDGEIGKGEILTLLLVLQQATCPLHAPPRPVLVQPKADKSVMENNPCHVPSP